ncbi:WD40 repeat domain-containing protein [Gordonia amicalis]|uniref:WD40 repeat domain-containing protein n=1 Tax=Gordonia amicalis TaxID=89053 RepID=UPI000464D3D8|nr:PD40 domain-containing protein [Gordonia amicalis]
MDFGEALARLFVQAGRPTLRASAARAKVSAQRISDWRNGRHLPRDFATVEPLLVWLTSRAVAAGVADALTIPQWRELWHRHLNQEAPETPAPPARHARPYAGLATLTAADSELYFGRDDLVGVLVDTIITAGSGPSMLSPSSRLVVVTGVSGSGKSSLLRAGLARDPRISTPRLAEVTPDGLTIAPPVDGETDAVIVIDQFENVFSLADELRSATMREVEELAADTVVVVGVRADFFSQCVEHPFLADAWQNRCVIVSEMTRTQLREVITAPVRLAGGRIEAGLADVMITDLYEASTVGDRAGRLPLLAHVLQATWARRSGNRMTLSGYRATGGIARAVADTAEAAWEAIAPEHRDLARAVLLSLVHVGPAGIALRVPLSTSTVSSRFPPEVSTVIDEFAQARLLTVSAESVMLVHDVVLTAWPRLAAWIADDSDTHVWWQQLDADTQSWVDNGRSRSFLYTGSRLDDAKRHREALRSNYVHLLSRDNDEFLDSAVAAQRRRRLLQVGAVSVIAVLAIAASITAVIGFRQAHDLRQQRNAAERAALLSHIDSMEYSNPSLAARLLLVAHQLYPDDPTVAGRLRGAATSPLATQITGHTGPVYDLAFDRSGRYLASASGDRTVRVWESTDSTPRYRAVATLHGFGNYVTSTGFHPTRPLLATSSGDGSVRIWDLSDPARPVLRVTVPLGRGTVYMARFSADGRTLAASSDDGSITVFAVSPTGTLRETAVIRGHGAAARTLSFSPDGRLLASGGDDRVVRLWTTGEQPVPVGAPITGFPSITHAVTFSPDSRSLAVTGDSPNAQLWDVTQPLSPRPLSTALPTATAGSWSVAFDPTGSQVASARADGTVRVWNTTNRSSPTAQWALQTASEQGSVRTFSAAFDPTGDRLVSGRSDGTIDVWSLPDRSVPDRGGTISGVATDPAQRILATVGSDTTLNVWTLDGAEMSLRSRTPVQRRVNDHPRVSVNERGTLAATANNNGGLVELWDIGNPDAPRAAARLPVATRYSFPVGFAPTGNVLATGDTDTTIALWDTSDPTSPTRIGAPLRGPADLIRSVAFSPDGTRLAVTSDDKRVYLYDLTTRDTNPVTVIADDAPVTQAAFDDDGEVLVVAARDLSTWRLPATDTDGEAELIDRHEDMYANTLSMSPNRIAVGTATHELISFALADDGTLSDRQSVGSLLNSTDTTTTWQVPVRLPADDEIIAGGDTTGNVYVHTLAVPEAREWVCDSTTPMTEAQRETYLPHADIRGDCD